MINIKIYRTRFYEYHCIITSGKLIRELTMDSNEITTLHDLFRLDLSKNLREDLYEDSILTGEWDL